MAETFVNDRVILAAAGFQREIGAQPATEETRLRDDVNKAHSSVTASE